MKRSKAEQQKLHAKRRIRERFGISLNDHQLAELVKQIQSSKLKLVEKQSNRISVFLAKIPSGENVRLVYDKNSHTIVTVMPEGARTFLYE